jgi:HTH-type transcriptional regulator/antitoxin HigA
MDVKPIKTEADYEAALAEIERLFDAKPETPEGDRLEILAALVEIYEDEHTEELASEE